MERLAKVQGKENWLARLRGLAGDFVDFCYPPVCASCGLMGMDDSFLCRECLDLLQRRSAAPYCRRCGLSLSYAEAPCPHCRGKGVNHFRAVLRLGAYEPPLPALIWAFKYHRQWMVGEELARQMFQQEAVAAQLVKTDCLLPVPLHYLRQFSRGYNQADVIARRLSRLSGLPVIYPVKRVRATPTQTHLHHRARRMSNLREAFALRDPMALRGRRVLVIDDVMTTGATLQTLARAVKPAKPAQLAALVVAVADRKQAPPPVDPGGTPRDADRGCCQSEAPS